MGIILIGNFCAFFFNLDFQQELLTGKVPFKGYKYKIMRAVCDEGERPPIPMVCFLSCSPSIHPFSWFFRMKIQK